MRILLLTALTGLLSFSTARAQDWTPPANVKLEKAADYAAYEKDVLACIDWLERTPLDKSDRRKAASAFLLQWVSGSPDVSIELREEVATFMKSPDAADLMVMFMGGWTRYALNDANGGKDNFQGSLAGLKSTIKLYRDTGGCQKDKSMDELVKLEKSGKLEDWLRKQLAKKG